MSDPVSTARSARESLARGLSALQSDPNLPPQMIDLAAPIAQAMGALMQIERSQGAQIGPYASAALSNVRTALSQLQAQPTQHPVIVAAMEAVAGSLAHVHSLGKMGAALQPAVAPPPVAPPPHPAVAHSAVAPSPQPERAPAPGGKAPPTIEAALGTQSATNFYKGLSGNDIVDHGGLFVSTYRIPRIGSPVRLRVSLPGGYEFEANAVVRWSREQNDAGQDAPPGFGAQFTQISPEARQLVYRYVRNREPLFHDDL